MYFDHILFPGPLNALFLTIPLPKNQSSIVMQESFLQ